MTREHVTEAFNEALMRGNVEPTSTGCKITDPVKTDQGTLIVTTYVTPEMAASLTHSESANQILRQQAMEITASAVAQRVRDSSASDEETDSDADAQS